MHGFNLSIDYNTILETWVCKIIFIASDKTLYDCAVVNQEKFGIRVWSSYCKSVEDACKSYIANALGCFLELPHARSVLKFPKTLEELEIVVDLASVEKAAS